MASIPKVLLLCGDIQELHSEGRSTNRLSVRRLRTGVAGGLGLAGAITYTLGAITVDLDQPGAPRVTRALTLLLDEINHNPPSMPGDTRPITYQLTAHPSSAFNS